MVRSVHSPASDDMTRLDSSGRAATVVGRMYLEGILTKAEAEAGFLYAENVGAYECMNGYPPRHRQSPSFEFGRTAVRGLDLEARRRRCTAIQQQYDQMQVHVPSFPILISIVLEEVCCNDRPVHSLHHNMLKKILRDLAQKVYGFELREQRKADGPAHISPDGT